MAAKYYSDFEIEDALSQKSVEQLRGFLKAKGLPTTGRKEVLIQRLVDDYYESQTAVKSEPSKESPEDMNYTKFSKELPPAANAKQLQEITSIRLKAKVLQGDIEAVIRAISELSEAENNKVKVKIRIERLSEHRGAYVQLRDRIISLLADEEIENELCCWREFLGEIDQALDAAHEYLNEECHSEEQSSKGSVHKDSHQSSNLKLPRIELPKFSGDVLKFQNFWDQFEAAVHDNADLPNVQKFTYLRSVLNGNALQTTEGFEVTGANYQPAVECLKHRYGRRRVVISSLVKSVVQMDAKSVVTAPSLRDLYDTLKNRTRALEALGEIPKSHGCILLAIFELKLPSAILEKWELELADTPDDEIDLELFFKFLNRQVVSKEAGERNLQGNLSLKGRSTNKGRDGRRYPPFIEVSDQEQVSTASALFSEAKPLTVPSCRFCRGGHGSLNCPEFNGKAVDDRWKLVQECKLCFNCLKPTNSKHFSKICRQPQCPVVNCGKRHHKLLHSQPLIVATENPTNTTLTGLAASKSSTTMKETLLQTALAKLSVNGQEVTVRVLLDSGSQRSYIRKNIAESIGLQGPSEVLSVATLGGETSESKRFQRVRFTLSPIQGHPKEAVEMEALTLPKICNPLGPVKLSLMDNPHLQGLTLADSYPRNSVQVDVLIGADHYYSFVTGTCKRGENPESLVAVESYFGWIITGPVDSYSKHTSAMLTMVENNEVTASLRRFWELESIGIVEAVNPTMSQEEELAVNDFNDGLNLMRDHPKLENNYAQVVKRLESIEKKLKRDPEKAEAYTTAINQYVEKGFAEEVLDLTSGDGSVRYLPHHAVFRADRQTTKCRIVFDASAREQDSVSLNDCVPPGPALQPNLASVLIRFRTHRIGMMADVEKMYLQIKLSPKDQDVHRYLWRDLKTDEAPKVYRMLRLTFGVNSSPFLAIATVNAHVNKYAETFPDATREILNNTYVDDCLTGADTDNSALKLQQEMSDIMMAAAFNLTKWASNSKLVMDGIDPDKRATSLLVECNSRGPLKALGVSWELISDCFRFLAPTESVSSHDPMTKKSLLSFSIKNVRPNGTDISFHCKSKDPFPRAVEERIRMGRPIGQ
ncbi:uncharacterized protein [Acropora muricata]|uniref:uncharacterized protein n=1 Tax=Acropora muricata TaxID=159855 RepID=UPI0034E536BB